MKALILVDIQNDFCPGGALAVPDGDEVVPVANEAMREYELVVATQDWHPPHHGSFAATHPGRNPGETIQMAGMEQKLWPVHCVQNTKGAELHPDLDRERIDKVFHKGTDPALDSYSGFFDNGHKNATGLGDFLTGRGVDEVHLMGLATDVCVKFTALDARELGFETVVHLEGCRGLDEKGTAEAIEEMREAGVEVRR